MDKNFQEEQCTGVIKFTPPLYKQRYQFVKDLVGKYKPKKVADLGCADCTLLWMLKSYNCIEVLAGLDICASVMKEKMHRLYPLPGDYLQPAERSLTVTLHHGSVAHEDPCMLGFDLVTCIELIEHLEESELEKFPEVVFGFMAPTMVVISTPNSEFNPLLPGVTVFRHQDHKFEWDRAQFQSWALDAAKRYDYSVEFTGVGNPPTGVEDVGFCTQIAVFVKKYPQTSEPAQSKKPTEAAYKTVFKAVYPSLKDEKYLQNAVVTEVMFTAHVIKRSLLDHLVSEQENYNDDPTERKLQLQRSVNCFSEDLETLAVEKSVEPLTNGSVVYIPLRKIFSFPKVNRLCGTFEKLCELITGKVTLSSDGSAVVLNTEHENEEN
ncbi:small RNA 2'-O-methyltransferase isoform X1 [Anser cygnoides]|uniref:small RNA 2'-O-methyltransferase isoform X1 n=1 Tax=Anser cygnoides TaxID=8845 RepID=UPI002009665D|nr:small RNA 2'-O-methyltransferase [Anser cygnoides]XP_013046180.2 small RNA 2'-O-methyltransferase [Anser cygnoides]XP_013046181.2 small RNA 2'-O-methyltransferase [Anser cygnoides]XP_013046182.2 small RNA 2'-O-methyltransferase [Anser cygnoides]XP_047922871.1 small RNA 2'-O-methyltransferase [Anser cygnoides]